MTSGIPPPAVRRRAPRRRRFDHTPALRTAASRGESLDQVLDRNVAELLQELRVAFTGVQILFAFLLGLAFTQRFRELGAQGVVLSGDPTEGEVLGHVRARPMPPGRGHFVSRRRGATLVQTGWQPIDPSGDRGQP